MKHISTLCLLLVLITACGKHSKGKSSSAPAAAQPVVTKVTETPTLTPSEEKFVAEFQDEFKLPAVAVEEMKLELEKTEDKNLKSNLMFCVGLGVATMVDMVTFSCRSFKGDKINLGFIGLGASLSIHTDLTVLYGKKGSRPLKEGTYNVRLTALHLGLGGIGLRITNDNESINWRMKGLTLGLGLNSSIARMKIEKFK